MAPQKSSQRPVLGPQSHAAQETEPTAVIAQAELQGAAKQQIAV